MKTTHLLTLLLTATAALGQGRLAPLVAPAPTMKTLEQIEARTPIPPSPAVPPVGPHFTITKPGSYYLTGNITVSSGEAIVIDTFVASDVSIDLNGFTIRSTLTGSSSGSAIRCNGTFTRLTVRDGFLVSTSQVTSVPPKLQGFSNGIISGGILSEAFISNVHVSGMSNKGIFLDRQSIVENCTATKNGGDGIYASDSTVTNCSASSNRNDGIYALDGIVINCCVLNNLQDGISAIRGIVTNCRASGNGDDGIEVGVGVVTHCLASDNDADAVATDYQIKVTAGGQRIGSVPATEAGSP